MKMKCYKSNKNEFHLGGQRVSRSVLCIPHLPQLQIDKTQTNNTGTLRIVITKSVTEKVHMTTSQMFIRKVTGSSLGR